MTPREMRATRAQELWWTVHNHNQGSAAGPLLRLDDVDDVVVAARRLRVPLDAAALERSLRLVAARHEALRTGLVQRAGDLFQRVEPESTFALQVVNLVGHPADQQLAEVYAAARDDARHPFDLERPLVRVLLARLGGEDSVLVVSVLHAVFDDFSHQLLVKELRALYAELMGARQPPLPAPVPFCRFSEWQLDWQRDERLRAQHEYWSRKLHGYRASINLPVLRSRATVELDTRTSRHVTVPPACWQVVLGVARAERITPFALVITALSAILAHQAGQGEVAIGAIYGNRRLPWTQSMMGLLANTLLLRISLADAPTFRVLMKRVAADWVAALAAGEVPFDELASSLGVSRLPGRDQAPAYEALVNFHVASDLNDDDRPSWMEPWSPPNDDRPASWAGCLLHITLWVTDAGALEARFRYTAELLADDTVEAIALRFEALLRELPHLLERSATQLGGVSTCPTGPEP